MTGPKAYTHIERLPEELLRYVLLDIDSIPSLYKLIQAVPAIIGSCIAIFDDLISNILRKSIDEELRCYLYAIVSAQIAGRMMPYDLGFFLDARFDLVDSNEVPQEIPRSRQSIEYMSQVLEAVDFFSTLCPEIWSWCGCVGLFQKPILPLSMWKDKYRLRRALLRFQLYCELFHGPGDDSPKSFQSTWGWEDNWDAQELFWMRYEWWEVEECKCIYYTLIFHLEYLTKKKEHSSSSCCFELEARGSLRGKREWGCNIRGLPTILSSLQTTCPQTLPPFQKTYLQTLLQRPFSGFRIIDPEDHGHFSESRLPAPLHVPIPIPDYRTSRYRRWLPSPFPGVTLKQLVVPMYGCNTVPREVRRLDTLPKRRQVLRYLGWCFWERRDLAEWAFFGAGLGEFGRGVGVGSEGWFFGGGG